MKKTYLILLAVTALSVSSYAADTLKVSSFRHAGPFTVSKPFMVDSLDTRGKTFDAGSILDTPLSFDALKGAGTVNTVPEGGEYDINLLGFSIQNESFSKAKIDVKGLELSKLFVDGKKIDGGDLKLEPGTHDIVIKYVGKPDDDGAAVNVMTEKGGTLGLREDGRHIYSLDINSNGVSSGRASLSPGGKYMVVGHTMTADGGKTTTYYEIVETASGKTLFRTTDRISWLPSRDAFWYVRGNVDSRDLLCTDPATGEETVMATNIPEGHFSISPTEDYLIYSLETKGPVEGAVHEILVPDDRQPGWRDRSYLAKYDISTGLMQPLTFGYNNAWLSDISDDGKYILFSTRHARLTKRPTSLTNVYRMNVATMETECIIEDEGFIGNPQFSPDGRSIVITGSGEAFGGMASEVKPGQIPNAYHYLLFVMDLASRSVRHLTKGFGPSVDGVSWSRTDGKIYFKADEKDIQTLYRVNPENARIERIPAEEEYIYGFDIASDAPMLTYYGQSLSNGDRVYLVDTRSLKGKVVHDFSAERFKDVDLGKGDAFEFTSSRGDRINGFYVLPPDFDPAKKYPLLVHYYGGCSPSARYCTGAYSPQVYAAQGYVFYVINPSGAAGFGQEFAARHVNTAGDVVADDIIEGTKAFCEAHPFIDTEKIGCFSASYGGFMTQLLLTKTDMYATGISHAGISDHTSYWGEGYWGYSYSEISMADSYPWTRKDLYVDRSPLYNADKIHTPLLFIHGSVDTNVPIGESIQMFTALKLLGEDTAFVVVDGSNHQVRDYTLRRQWLRTIFAWFAKYLKDDPAWWEELYPEKNL